MIHDAIRAFPPGYFKTCFIFSQNLLTKAVGLHILKAFLNKWVDLGIDKVFS